MLVESSSFERFEHALFTVLPCDFDDKHVLVPGLIYEHRIRQKPGPA